MTKTIKKSEILNADILDTMKKSAYESVQKSALELGLTKSETNMCLRAVDEMIKNTTKE